MKLIFTKKLPTKEGYYWYTNFGEHTPIVLEVYNDHSTGVFYANGGEFSFEIEKPEPQQELALDDVDVEEDEWREKDGTDSYKYGDELWCYIPNPCLPNTKKEVAPDSY